MKPGHRKIVALFLVDPNVRIILTVNVPCQRCDWWVKTVVTPALGKLPVELQDEIVQSVEEFPLSLAKAKQLWEESMVERKQYVSGYQTRFFQEVTISLCER
jgi:hypothetical protein